MDREHEDFACWADSLRDKYPNRTDAYNFARDAWQEANRRSREACARASGFARQAAERNGECPLEAHL